MPSFVEYDEAYEDGYAAGYEAARRRGQVSQRRTTAPKETAFGVKGIGGTFRVKPKRKLSAWNKFVRANSNKPRFRYRNGKLNLKKMGVAFRKTPAGKKKRR
jgi:hypothetical protein